MQKISRHDIELLTVMTIKELRARYKYTIFGFFWLVANPLIQMLVIGFIFTFILKEPVKYYYFHLFIGLLIWNFFSISLNKTTPSIVWERAMIKKAKFSRIILPLSIILSNLFHFILAFLILMIPVSFLGTFSLIRIFPLLLGFILLISFTIGLCLLTTALNVRYRDINFFTQALLVIWFYATPIIYSFSLIPKRLLWLWRLNPMTSILQLFHYSLLDAPPPGPAMLTSNITVIIIVTGLGLYIFNKESKNFDDWV